jgi:hypothetical protein
MNRTNDAAAMASSTGSAHPMVAWIARGLLVAAGSVTSWFVANDAPNFGLVQIAVGLLLLSLVVSVIAFWPSSWTVKFNRFGKKD